MQKIILTKNRSEGYKLQGDLKKFFPGIGVLPCFIKDDLIANPQQFKNLEFIFSTWYMPLLNENEVEALLPSLKAIFYAAGSVRYFAEPFLKRGVKIFSAAKANGVAVAEFVVAQIILANKGYYQAQKTNKSILWRWAFKRAKRYSENRTGNYNSIVGLIGCGAVGSEVVRLLKPYHLEILVHDPFLSEERCQRLGVKNVSLSKLFELCDVVSNHLPDIPETKGIINYDLLSKMRDYTTFINTGRGAQLVEKDLSKVLKKRPTICAVLDVVEHEVLLPWSPLLRRKNVFLSPHIAGSIGNEALRMIKYCVVSFDDYVNGRSNENEITLAMLEKMA